MIGIPLLRSTSRCGRAVLHHAEDRLLMEMAIAPKKVWFQGRAVLRCAEDGYVY